MDNLDANHLPEVDSLPDGFVDGPALENGKPLSRSKEDTVYDLDHLYIGAGLELGIEFISSPRGIQRTKKTRTFPVPLSKTDESGASGDVIEVHVKQVQDSILHSVDQVCDDASAPGATSDNKPKEEVHCDSPSSERTRGIQGTKKSRTFPVPLSETGESDASGDVIQVHVKQVQDSIPHSVDQVCEDASAPGATSDNKTKEDVHCDSPSSERSRGIQRTKKSRTFPVPLSETGESDASGDVVQVHINQVQDSIPHSVDQVCDASAGGATSEKTKEDVNCDSPSSERSIQATSEMQNAELKDISSSVNIELSGSRKPEATKNKRKNAKKMFRSEKEFLELTLKYQQVVAERDSAIIVRDKLESLCRELQRQNKEGEWKRVLTEGKSLRLELSSKFEDAIKDVSNKLEEQKEESLFQLRENEMLRTNLKHLADDYILAQQQILQLERLELEISGLEIKQHEEKLAQDQSQLKLYVEQALQLLGTEKNLQVQLTSDGEKFPHLQEALAKSDKILETFKLEIDKMSNSIEELKKENEFLKSKCERSDYTIAELVGERQMMKEQLERTKNQKEKLESLCRSLHAERKQSCIPPATSL
ncbi:Txlna [Linum grandiflorum]